MLKPELSKSNFVLLIISLAPNITPKNQQEILRKSFNERQARVYLANCIEMILVYGEASDLENIFIQACSPTLDWT